MSHRQSASAWAERLRVAFAVGGLHTEGSGVARIVCDLANALLDQGTPVQVYTANCPGRGAEARWLAPGNRLHAPPGRWLRRLAWSPALKRMLNGDVSQFDIVHNHSLWMLPNSYATRAARRHDVPVVFTAHGFLEPWALSHSRWKKRLAGWMFQNRDLESAACIHVNSLSELESIRKYGLRNPVAIVPNGIRLDDFANMPPRDELEDFRPEVRGKRVCLFLSRLHEKKGLGHLVESWSRVHHEFRDWHLVIAGPDDGYKSQLEGQIRRLGLERSVTQAGPLYGSKKLAAYSAAEAFVLPSFSEGFSMAVLEALAAGLPVMITPGCHFPEATNADAGIEVLPDVENTTEGLRVLLALPSARLSEMGRQGRRLIEEQYTWNAVASRMQSVYRWVSSGGPAPRDVVTN